MNDIWIPKPVALRFSLGEITLFAVKFTIRECNKHFLTWGADAEAEPNISPDAFREGMEGALVRSYPTRRPLRSLTTVDGVLRYVPSQYQRYYVDLRQTFEQYLQKFSSKSRSTLLRKVRKFKEFSKGKIDFRKYDSPGDVDEFIEKARSVSSLTYQERLLNAGLPRDDEFVTQARRRAASGGMRGYMLFHDDTPVSYLYCPVEDDVLLYQFLGFDPAFRTWSPGTVLQYLALESLLDESKFHTFDFTEGEGPHKEFFATGSLHCADIYYFKKTLKSWTVIVFHRALSLTVRGLVQALEAINLKRNLKRLVRSWR